jgi:hypothetical protein
MKVTLIKNEAIKSTKSQSLVEILLKDGWKVFDEENNEPIEEVIKEPIKRGRKPKGE